MGKTTNIYCFHDLVHFASFLLLIQEFGHLRNLTMDEALQCVKTSAILFCEDSKIWYGCFVALCNPSLKRLHSVPHIVGLVTFLLLKHRHKENEKPHKGVNALRANLQDSRFVRNSFSGVSFTEESEIPNHTNIWGHQTAAIVQKKPWKISSHKRHTQCMYPENSQL